MSNHCVKIWCNSEKRTEFTALVSSLKLNRTIDWEFSTTAEEATLWCLIDFDSEKERLLTLFHATTIKPKVICLAQRFSPPPHPDWTFFKTPINVIALHNWIKRKFTTRFEPPQQSNTDDVYSQIVAFEEVVAQHKWQTSLFRLRYWPNVTEYSDSPEMIKLCAFLLKDWVDYNKLPEHNIPKDIIEKLLLESEADNNLVYQSNQVTQIDAIQTHITPTKKKVEEGSWGFFRSLLNKLIG